MYIDTFGKGTLDGFSKSSPDPRAVSNRSMQNDPLLRPYRIKRPELRNRIVSTAHEPASIEDGMPKERYRLYHAEKARGGMALTMTAGSALVSRDSPAAFGNLHAYRDEIVPWLRELSDACHEHDCKVMIQLTHLGRRTGWNRADWLPVLAPSSVREPAHRSFPKVMEDWDIERIVADYASAVQRCKEAGLDGIEIEAYGHLMDGFWSPLTNHRDDEYGGSLDNRLRFTWMVLDAVRAAVGTEFIVGLRLVADEDVANGLSRAEGMEIARRLAGRAANGAAHRICCAGRLPDFASAFLRALRRLRQHLAQDIGNAARVRPGHRATSLIKLGLDLGENILEPAATAAGNSVRCFTGLASRLARLRHTPADLTQNVAQSATARAATRGAGARLLLIAPTLENFGEDIGEPPATTLCLLRRCRVAHQAFENRFGVEHGAVPFLGFDALRLSKPKLGTATR